MITCDGGKKVPCVMKASLYIRFYERRHGVKLPHDRADEEAAKEGFVLDHSGECQPRGIRGIKAPRAA